jgi:hypothetical protein
MARPNKRRATPPSEAMQSAHYPPADAPTIRHPASGRVDPPERYIPGEPLDACVPKVWLKALDFAIGATVAAVVVHAAKTFDDITGDADPDVKREKMRIIASGVSAAGILLWPVIWDTVAGYSLLVHHPLTIFGFLWPMVMAMIDLGYSSSARSAVAAERVFGIGQLSSDANTLVGVAFAVGSLLASQSNAVADATVPLLMYALILLIAFIIPTPSLDPNDYAGFLAGAVQRMFFNYAMGFVITGVTLNISGTSDTGLNNALRRICMRKRNLIFQQASAQQQQQQPSGYLPSAAMRCETCG